MNANRRQAGEAAVELLTTPRTRTIKFSPNLPPSRYCFNGMATPVVHVQRPSDESASMVNLSAGEVFNRTGEPIWHCCKCGMNTSIQLRPGEHPLGALACECPHKPCCSCKTMGPVKPFLPMEEPCMVPVADEHKEIRFGVLCPTCGLSWRAKEIGRYKKTLRKIPSLSFSQRRLTPAHMALRKSKSTMVLGNKRIITPPGQAIGKQALYATVKFSNVKCTCGTVIDINTTLCFQIIGQPLGAQENEDSKSGEDQTKKVGWTTTPELEEQGHGDPFIKIRGIRHMNPLRSCPVTEDDMAMLDEIRGRHGH